MAIQSCPRCGGTGQFLTVSKASPTSAILDYFRCDDCGGIWVTDRMNPAKRPRLVAKGPKPSDDDAV